ncbi:S1 RNA-binding domain-containing protein [Acholeplasma vituli]|uniref:S1 RNA-binding domain-containing protein n=1 Tax=Paracholeplasma vituli TaxID=69473 RepID=A0ABT2PX73_9MOLU|nr:S1 RNA-binding domain-containing protein [Paracholeplasma vituli]MCU0105318.1 S1 RNA-binding domain-containing protein [Paracholeplasma vituli]
MYQKGDIIDVVVTGIAPYGVFVKINEYTGLIHISEISDKFVRDISQFAMTGDQVKVIVIEVDKDNKQLKLSYKKCDRSKKIKICDMKIGFKTLEENLPKWIEQKLENH